MGKPPLYTSQESAPALPLHIAVVNNSLSGPAPQAVCLPLDATRLSL